MFTTEKVVSILRACGLMIADQRRLERRPGRYLPVPSGLHPRLAALLKERYPKGLYAHQARGIEAALAGHSVCLSTATASGKSLVFVAAAADLLLRDPAACVVAFYPARALIQDQMRKWRELLQPLGLRWGYIDGGVGMRERLRIVREHRLLLMTPDVTHAWLLPDLTEPPVRSFLDRLAIVILDEAHVYDGVFGSNFALFMRRLRAVSGVRQCISSTATLGDPEAFIATLTGFKPVVLGPESDGAPAAAKTLILARPDEEAGEAGAGGGRRRKGEFDVIVEFVRACAAAADSPFLGFADSRRMVERIVSASVHRQAPGSAGGAGGAGAEVAGATGAAGPQEAAAALEPEAALESEVAREPGAAVEPEAEGVAPAPDAEPALQGLLPYRAGYEDEDRHAIQEALTRGELRGVISTSALELGIDVGEVDLVVLLQPPSSVKAFWQRVGRAGRVRDGVCVVLDPSGTLADGLARYLDRPVEANRLYLDNRYLQYANALCAAVELNGLGAGGGSLARFESLPASFSRMLANELEPREAIPPDLAPLKQRALAGPHREFPLRNAVEREFQILGWGDRQLGSVTYSQALREAYPGAVYYYMARPYRVTHFDFGKARIRVHAERFYTTDPILQRMAFPRWPEGLLGLWTGEGGAFVAEAEMQVSERCTGFVETRGSAKERHEYGPESPYFTRPLNRFFETTGVVWWAPGVRLDELAAQAILGTFCDECGVQERDVGLGQFTSRLSPTGQGEVHGWCIYDATYGSLRLTRELAERFGEMARAAVSRLEDGSPARAQLERLAEALEGLRPAPLPQADLALPAPGQDDDWQVVVARGEPAMLMKGEASEEVVVEGYRYTPRGIVYDLRHPDASVRWQVSYDRIQPIHGVTRLVRWNLVTGEEQPL
ncbi:DEAD/DEAH box helicase [Geochorda subterranea]|uniref:DEAD/DEAH box helicase n=1 Tax=Geochorda subterranea TaxID=3109564 RepID=A0ABZ1BSH5_9FIRM|nr:DEAD/DEAH box helicase [Limnochorda sp. LNt]WRP15746.1 DEAD/DEAH box helicase [Limnochorda sp. LNt]